MGAVMQQNTPSYDIGFNTGAKYAEQTASHMLSSNRVSAAHAYTIATLPDGDGYSPVTLKFKALTGDR
jgi:hypothetical protein